MENRIKAIIVEDEKLARQRLKKLLMDHQDFIEVIGEADNGEDGADLANKLRPDVIFLDIQMPILNGFEMLDYLEYKANVIFTTAFEEYAIAAFEANSIDYVLKPIKKERLAQSIDRLRNLKVDKGTEDIDKMLEVIANLKETTSEKRDSIAVSVGEKIVFVKFDNINFFKAEDKYVFIHTDNSQRHIIDYSLTNLEKKLPSNFTRVHRAHILNMDKVKEIHKGFNGKYIFIINDVEKTQITCGTSYIRSVKEKIKF